MFDRMLKLFTGDMTPDQKRFLTRISFRFLLVAHVAWACGWLAPIGLTGFAQAGELDGVKSDIKGLARNQNIQTRSIMEADIQRLDQAISDAEGKIIEAKGNNDIIEFYTRRLSELRSQRAGKRQRLDAFLLANPDIAGVAF